MAGVSLDHDTEKLLFENELALLVFLTALVCLVVFPSYRCLALSTGDITHDVSPGCHASFDSFTLCDIDDIVEEVCFAVLASEVLGYDIVEQSC